MSVIAVVCKSYKTNATNLGLEDAFQLVLYNVMVIMEP